LSIDLPGFADPVISAQSTFRAILEAMSRPGTIQPAGAGLTPPVPLVGATASCLLTLVDTDVGLHAGDEFDAAWDWIAFHCGARFVPADAADFVLATTLPDLATLASGSDDGPQDSATVILQVQGFGSGTSLVLSGPGLKVPATLKVAGLPADFVSIWAANHAMFPRGIDLILCAGDRLVALPRSLRIAHEIKEA
jgi:alpha-D-ribose 1-methylphosphonate 5-triphosphate synthase subunit PhnH